MLDLKLVNKGDTAEVFLIGNLDSASAPGATDALKQTAERFDHLILNLEKLNYTSSAGLRIFKMLYAAMNKKGGTLELTKVQPMVMEVLEITGFAGILKIS